MDIKDRTTAEAWLRAWGGRPPRGIAAAAVRGLRRASRICRSRPDRYAEDTVRGYEAAADLIERTALRDTYIDD